jgi:hypothetical protein
VCVFFHCRNSLCDTHVKIHLAVPIGKEQLASSQTGTNGPSSLQSSRVSFFSSVTSTKPSLTTVTMALPLSLFRSFSVQDLLQDHATSKKAKRQSKSLSSSNLRFSTLADYGDGMGSAQSGQGKVGTVSHSCLSFFPLSILGESELHCFPSPHSRIVITKPRSPSKTKIFASRDALRQQRRFRLEPHEPSGNDLPALLSVSQDEYQISTH